MSAEKTYDLCYFLNYDTCTDLHLYEIGMQACPPDYFYGPTIRNHYIFHYIIDGQGILHINNQQYTISAHQGFIIPPNVVAHYKADMENPWSYVWIHLDGPKTKEFFHEAGLSVEQPVFTPRSQPNDIYKIMNDLLVNSNKELYCIGKIFEWFDCIIDLSTNRLPSSSNTKLTYIKKIIDFVHIKYSETICMDDIAHVCCLERSYMTRLFKNATGQTPQEYLTSYRMKVACRMLVDQDFSIQNIAYAIGYGDSFTFSKAFKRYTGLSPSQYRKKQLS